MTNNNDAQTREAQAKAYSRIRIKLSIISLCVTLVLLLVSIVTRLTVVFRDWAGSITDNYFLTVGLYFLFFYFFILLIDYPLEWYSSFHLEHKYALSNLSWRGWIWEDVKKRVLALLLGLLIVVVLYAIIRVSPSLWWFWCWLFWIFFSLVLGKLAPILIVPLFYKYTEITDEHLKSIIQRLVSDTKLKIKNVYSLNLSKTTKKANAAFMGLGRTKRVVLGDTLLSQFTPSEIEMVIAHEVGHYKYKHVLKHILNATVGSFLAFYIAYQTLFPVNDLLGLQGMTDVALFPVICLVFFLLNVFVMPIQNWFSRRMEWQADAYSLSKTRNKEAFIATMRKLGELNLSDPSPHPVIEFIFYSHPSLQKRIAWAQAQSL